MTEADVIPFLTHEWRPTLDIARDVYEAEGRRGGFGTVLERVRRTLCGMEERGRAERTRMSTRGRPSMWRLAE